MRKCLLSILFLLCLFSLNNIIYAEAIPKTMDVHFIDVGQGDSIYIHTPNDKHVLIDGGKPKYGEKVVNYLDKQKVDNLDVMVSTHPDYDHIGGLVNVLKEYDVKQIIDSGKMHNTRTYGRYLNEVRKQDSLFNLAVANETIDIDQDLTINIFNSHKRGKDNNEASIVLKITYQDVSFLLMGDIDGKQEKQLIKKYDVQADVIKVSHHGSKTSSSMEFLSEVNPRVAMITYKKKNRFGHPVDRVITNLNKLDTHIYSTAVFGDVVFHTDGKNYYIFTEKSPNDGILEEAS